MALITPYQFLQLFQLFLLLFQILRRRFDQPGNLLHHLIVSHRLVIVPICRRTEIRANLFTERIQITHCILPSISTIVVLNLIISVSGALSAFEMPYVVTGGGFNTSTYFVVMDKIAHTDQKVGLASAMAVVLLLLIVIVTYAQKAVEKWLENRSSGVTK